MQTSTETQSATKKECIWMKMGLVSYRICTNNFQCGSCEFDQAMSSGDIDAGGFQALAAKVRYMPASQRKCRYMLAGLVSYKICSNSYECSRCEYDQMMEEMLQKISTSSFAQKRKSAAAKKHTVAGYLMPLDLYYHKGHLWVKANETGSVTVGLDDFAQKLIGPCTYVNLPKPGTIVKAGEVVWQLRCGDRVADALSPIDGIIAAVNKDVVEKPELLNKSPYTGGWLFAIDPADTEKWNEGLMNDECAEKWLEGESERLHEMVSAGIGVSLSDGGYPATDVFGDLGASEWKSRVESFLKP
ncbi:MAG: glycine cleavage system protein H [bacterium]